MVTKFSGNERAELMGFPMLFPITWQENVAANMKKVPAFEFFPGAMVNDLYKAYQSGVTQGKISPLVEGGANTEIVSYLAKNTGKSSVVVADFLLSLVTTVNAGKAPRDVLMGKPVTTVANAVSNVVNTSKSFLTLAVIGIVGVAAISLLGKLPSHK